MSPKDPSDGVQLPADAAAAPKEDSAAQAAENKEGVTQSENSQKTEEEIKAEEKGEEISDDELIAEISTEKSPPKNEENSDLKAIEEEKRQNGKMVKVIAAYNKVKKAVDDGADLDDAIKSELGDNTRVHGAVKKLFNGEDPFPGEKEKPQDAQAIASQAIAKDREEQQFKSAFVEITKENGINTNTTTSIEKRKQLKAGVEALIENPSKVKILKALAAQMFGAPKTDKKEAVAGKVEPSKVKKPSSNSFEGIEKSR